MRAKWPPDGQIRAIRRTAASAPIWHRCWRRATVWPTSCTLAPTHEPNELWDTGRRILVLDVPLIGTKRKRIRKMYEDPRTTVVTDNLRWFAGRYEAILKKRPEDWQETGGDERMEFRKKYYQYIETQLADVEAKLRGRTEAPRE